MKTLTATDLKVRCLALFDELAETGVGLLITKRARPVARVYSPAAGEEDPPQFTLADSVECLSEMI
ncbi:MAG: hypothetical protein CME06_15660 [Gemmatimonadetes bacterium]|nr:hypothetical protein [Gemmatimonadota bacterium]